MTELAEKIPEIDNFPAECMTYQVTDQDSFARAGEAIKALKGLASAVKDYFNPLKTSAHKTWKEICLKENQELDPITRAEDFVRTRMNSYLAEEERKRQEIERRRIAEEEERARKEREKLEAQAKKAEAAGKVDKAEDLREKAADVYVAPVTVAPTTGAAKTDTAHVLTQDKLIVEVADLKAFLAALIAQGSAMTMIEVKQTKLEAWAKANGVEKFPGLRIETTKIAVVR